jgi:hypothetical protein
MEQEGEEEEEEEDVVLLRVDLCLTRPRRMVKDCSRRRLMIGVGVVVVPVVVMEDGGDGGEGRSEISASRKASALVVSCSDQTSCWCVQSETDVLVTEESMLGEVTDRVAS